MEERKKKFQILRQEKNRNREKEKLEVSTVCEGVCLVTTVQNTSRERRTKKKKKNIYKQEPY